MISLECGRINPRAQSSSSSLMSALYSLCRARVRERHNELILSLAPVNTVYLYV